MTRSTIAWTVCCTVLMVVGLVLLWPQSSDPQRPAAEDTHSIESVVAPPRQPAPSSVSTPSAASTAPSPSPTPLVELHGHVPEDQASWDPPAWDEAAREDARQQATHLVQAWLTDDDVTDPTWWREAAALMTEDAQELMVTVDRDLLIPADVTGSASILAAPSPYLVEVKVPTTQGPWRVVLVRESADHPWLSHRWEPFTPDSDGP